MEQLSLSDTNVDWRALLEHVVRDNVTIDIQEGNTTVARILPIAGGVSLGNLNAVLASLPHLEDDANSFANDLEAIRSSLLPESNPWD
jgi:hypothetical protein